METTFVNNNLAFKLDNGTTIITDGDAEFEYRSHIKGFQCTVPNNWITLHGKDKDGNFYTAWYYVEDEIEEGYDMMHYIDFENPHDITDDYNHVIYEKEYENK